MCMCAQQGSSLASNQIQVRANNYKSHLKLEKVEHVLESHYSCKSKQKRVKDDFWELSASRKDRIEFVFVQKQLFPETIRHTHTYLHIFFANETEHCKSYVRKWTHNDFAKVECIPIMYFGRQCVVTSNPFRINGHLLNVINQFILSWSSDSGSAKD